MLLKVQSQGSGILCCMEYVKSSQCNLEYEASIFVHNELAAIGDLRNPPSFTAWSRKA